MLEEVIRSVQSPEEVVAEKAHVKLMKDEWRRISDTDPLVSVVDKLRKLKVFLKQWNRVTFGSIDAQIEAATTLLNELDEKLDNMDENMVSMRRKVQGELWRLLRYRESIWDREWLKKPFTLSKVWDVVRACDGSKTQGPDGYNKELFKSGWSFLQEDVMRVFSKFYLTG
ncbi:hypothetical protein V6N12_058394 [Hibiscus sabdariffa]|uniref:Uncharacterized protein n=1 Tax=Hibiscus sabdariffa TaxID=183260 RepID=A0ABR2EUM2_9ROSI